MPLKGWPAALDGSVVVAIHKVLFLHDGIGILRTVEFQ